MTFKSNTRWFGAITFFIALFIHSTNATVHAETNRVARTLHLNQTLSIFTYNCALSLRSISTSKVVVRCARTSNGNRQRPSKRPYLRRRQSAAIRAKSCSLQVLSNSAGRVKLQCGSFTTTPTATATPTPTATPLTNLSVNVTNLALSVNDTALNAQLTGNPRTLIITNVGSVTAHAITFGMSPSPPSGTTISSTCSNLVPLSSCTVTITPGGTPSAAQGNANPSPIVVTISGTDTNTVTSNVHILTYGSVYQGGYLFAVDDTTPNTSSIGGKVVAQSDQSTSIAWDPGCPGSCTGSISANSNFDGAANSAAIIAGLSSLNSASAYAAGLCTQTIAGFSDWYLPATCEMSYGDNGGSPCGQVGNPTIQNIQSNIGDLAIIPLTSSNWSSTEIPGAPSTQAIFNIYGSGGLQFGDAKETGYSVRCVRALS